MRFRRYAVLGVVAGFAFFGSSTVAMQHDVGASTPAPLKQELIAIQAESGPLANRGAGLAVVYDETFAVEGATWLRLKFADVKLAGSLRNGTASYLRISSWKDGAVQYLDEISLDQWERSSAYFNGDAIRVELIAYPKTGRNELTVVFAWAGVPNGGELGGVVHRPGNDLDGIVAHNDDDNERGGYEDSQCGTTDDRLPSDDPRAGRAVPIGCTVNIIDDANRCFLTAGHCSTSSLQVIEFNVPPSDSNGNIQHPHPDDQYAVDVSSVQATNGGVGNDWGYFGCFPNSNTNLTPFQAQGAFFELADTIPPVQGQDIRITGYGVDSSPPERNQTQQTHAGPFWDHFGTTLQYRTDTQGGNSGSAVQDDTSGFMIGIHTHGGCNSSGGANSGTAIDHSGLQNALDNPRGVCRPGLAFNYPNGRPDSIDPSGGIAFIVEVAGQNGGQPQGGTGMLHYDAGGGFVSVPLQETVANTYEAVFPAVSCGTEVRYYVSAETTSGAVVTDPLNAPTSAFQVTVASSIEVVVDEDFEATNGWTVQNENVEGGPWERGVPLGGGDRGDPEFDYDGSGSCWVTGLADGNSDLDGGPTRLLSPVFDMTGMAGAVVQYARWFTNDDNDIDRLVVEVSNNDGASWTLLESIGDSSGWIVQQFVVSDFLALTDQMRFRFSATDNPNDSVTEAGIDAFSIRRVICNETELVGFSIVRGTLAGGGLDELLSSDDAHLAVDSTFGFSAQMPYLVELEFEFTTATLGGATIDLAIEGRINNPGGNGRARLFNYDQSTFEEIGQFQVGTSDGLVAINGIDAADRIRQSDGQMRVNIRVFVLAVFSPSGFRSNTDFVGASVN